MRTNICHGVTADVDKMLENSSYKQAGHFTYSAGCSTSGLHCSRTGSVPSYRHR